MMNRFRRLSTLAGVAFLAATTFAHARPLPQAQPSMAQPATPSGVVNQLLGMVEHDLVPLAEAMPADKYNFAPTNGEFHGVRTFADQLRHVIRANDYFFGDASSMKPIMPSASQLQTKEQIVAALKASFAFAHQAANSLTTDNALETVKPADGIATRAGIMLFAIVHMNDHYGQLVEYARMNGVIPPSSLPAPAKAAATPMHPMH